MSYVDRLSREQIETTSVCRNGLVAPMNVANQSVLDAIVRDVLNVDVLAHVSLI